MRVRHGLSKRTLSRRSVASLAILALLTGARLPVLSARSLIVPAAENPAIGTDFKVKAGGTVLASRFMDWSHARLDGAATVSIDRYSQDVDPQTVLRSHGATNESAKRTGLRAKSYFCGPDRRTQSELAYQLFGSVLGNVENFVRFCFSDEDGDNRFDHVFLGGSKAPELQVAREIDPLPFHALDPQPDEEDREMRIVLARVEPRAKNVLLYARPYKKGKSYVYGAFSLWDPATGAESKQRDKINIRVGDQGADLKDVIGYDIAIKSVDWESQEVTFTYTRSNPEMLYDGGSVGSQLFIIYI